MQTILAFCIVSALGLSIGKKKIGGISLGITFVFFIGIIFAHFGVKTDPALTHFAMNFGLIVFVYTLGLQVGPSFFSSLKQGGIKLNLLALAVIFIGSLMAIGLHYVLPISLPNMMGILSGAVTNTPALGAGQQTLISIDPSLSEEASNMALACAVTYPLGVIGVILAIILIRSFIPKKDLLEQQNPNSNKPKVTEFRVSNPALFNASIQTVMTLTDRKFVITRVWHDGKVTVPESNTVFHSGDHLLITSNEEDIDSIKILFGEQENKDWNRPDIDWDSIDSFLISKRIIVTKPEINGVKLQSLRLRNLYGININQIDRAGIKLMAAPDLHLQLGDRLTVVGKEDAVARVQKILGDEIKNLDSPNLTSVFVGIFIGVIVGLIPINIPSISTSVKLGFAGGPIIIGILMGAFGPRLKLTTYMTQSANLLTRQFGIVIYLAGLGLDSGANFFNIVFRPEGALWVGIGFILTIVPILIVAFFAYRFLKIEFGNIVGTLCGSMANPMALDYAASTIDNDDPAVSYATVYPLTMFVRVILIQAIILFLF